MPDALPYVKVYWDNYGTEITNVQSIQLDKGRTKISDEWRPGVGQINGRRNDLFPSGLEIGSTIRIELGQQGSMPVALFYRVADVTFNYGIIASLDTWTIALEDAFAYLGRSTIDVSWASGTRSDVAFTAICNECAIGVSVVANGKSTLSAQTIANANAQDLMQTVMNTEQGAVYANAGTLSFYPRGWQATATNINFTDTGVGTDPIRYDNVVFRSMADNYADYIVVYPRGSSEVVTGSGIYSYNLDSYSLNSGEATFLGQYIEGVFSVQNSTPSSISILMNIQTSTGWLTALAGPANARITLRGSVYDAIIIGTVITGDPSNIRVTFNLASSDFFSFLTLDNTLYGTLDYNKLGY